MSDSRLRLRVSIAASARANVIECSSYNLRPVCYNDVRSQNQFRSSAVAKKKKLVSNAAQGGGRAKLTPEESLKRVKEFPKRKEGFIAAVRKGKNRGVSA